MYNPPLQPETDMNDNEQERKGNRLSKIVTRTGDAGTTGLGDGSRVGKDSLRIDAIGEIDELNSSLGVLLCEDLPDAVRAALLDVQNDLFDLGGELCMPGWEMIKDVQVTRLERQAEEFNADLPMLKEFILPGGTRPAALTHLARTVCRRAERAIVRCAADDFVSDAARRYVNRLSDLLFILGRLLNRAGGRGDVLWQKGKTAA
jgi:cob(I)alamin adenosyltransferase